MNLKTLVFATNFEAKVVHEAKIESFKNNDFETKYLWKFCKLRKTSEKNNFFFVKMSNVQATK